MSTFYLLFDSFMFKVSCLAICCIIFTPVKAERISVWGNADLPPAVYVEAGQYKGYGVDIVKALFTKADVEYRMILAPWKRSYQQVVDGKGIIFGIFKSKKREERLLFTAPIWNETIVVVVKKGSEFKFSTSEDLIGKVVAVQRGAFYGESFEHLKKRNLFTLVQTNTPLSRLSMVYQGRAEVGIFNPGRESVMWHAEKLGVDVNEFTVFDRPLATINKYIAIAKSSDNEEIIEKLNAVIELSFEGEMLSN